MRKTNEEDRVKQPLGWGMCWRWCGHIWMSTQTVLAGPKE